MIIGMNRERFWSLLAAQTGVVFMSPPRASGRTLPSDAELRAALAAKPRSKPKAKPRRNRSRAQVRAWLVAKEDALEQATNPHARRRAGVERMERILEDDYDA